MRRTCLATLVLAACAVGIAAAPSGAADPGRWQLTGTTTLPLVYYAELVRRLRGAGAAGATTLRGIWGYHGDHAPHGDSVWQLRRRVPVLTVLVDTPANIGRWYVLVDVLTTDTGLVTSEIVPNAHQRPA